jgi:hypothetical protein
MLNFIRKTYFILYKTKPIYIGLQFLFVLFHHSLYPHKKRFCKHSHNFYINMFPSSYFFKKSDDSKDISSSKDEDELTSSIFASIVTPNAKKNKSKKNQSKPVPVKAHTRNIKGMNSSNPRNNTSKLVKVGTVVSRTFNTWPCSRRPGDPLFQKIFVEW